MHLYIISGRSGSGKSSALNLLADIGYYCIDNLPVNLLPVLVQQAIDEPVNEHNRIAVCIDSRNAINQLCDVPDILRELPPDVVCETLYFDAATPILLKRFSETRRRHPLTSGEMALQEALEYETHLLEGLSAAATLVIDTSLLSIHELRELLRQRLSFKQQSEFSLLFESFGFKHGPPIDADFIFDVRCLPNPHWVESIRHFNGTEQPIIDFLSQQPDVIAMRDDLCRFFDRWIPKFKAENRSYMTIAIGCTGGKHRSVFITEALANYYTNIDGKVLIRHRELPNLNSLRHKENYRP
ncbi:MAG TPA: RNase adapter RapZ [Pseudomonadales bacterium]|nr:RNase adapter RapZ [Pseudomonadales bacterium]